MRIHGYTFLEALITLVMVAILLMGSVHAVQHLVLVNRSSSQTNRLIDAINYARNAAITRNETVILCGSTNHNTCDGNWRAGQLVMVNQLILRIYSALPANDKLIWNGNFGQHGAIEFLATGFTNGQQGSFYYCPSTAEPQNYGKRIVLEQTGRVRVSDDAVKCE